MPLTYRTLRVDVREGLSEQYVQQYIIDWLEANRDTIPKACFAFEVSAIVQKPHFQGVLVTTRTAKRFGDLTPHFQDWAPDEKSFAICRNTESYLKYIKKDGDIRYYHGFTEEDIKNWGDWIKLSKEDKKVCHREQFYKEFVEFCKKKPDCDTGKYKLEWIARQLFVYLGRCPRSEQTAFCRGIIFSTQSVLLHGEDSQLAEKSIDRWISAMI